SLRSTTSVVTDGVCPPTMATTPSIACAVAAAGAGPCAATVHGSAVIASATRRVASPRSGVRLLDTFVVAAAVALGRGRVERRLARRELAAPARGVGELELRALG